jgi:hypothetical protein
MKSYCGDCKYLTYVMDYGSLSIHNTKPACKAVLNCRVTDNWKQTGNVTQYGDPKIDNKDNDCNAFRYPRKHWIKQKRRDKAIKLELQNKTIMEEQDSIMEQDD